MFDSDKEWAKLQRDETIMRWSITALIAFLLCLFVLTSAYVLSAPAPLPPEKKKAVTLFVPRLTMAHLVGTHSMQWSGGTWQTTFALDGSYTAGSPSDTLWTGFSMIGADGTLYVSEAITDENGVRGAECRWCVTWKKNKDNLIDATTPTGDIVGESGSEIGAFKLVRIKKPN